MLELWNTGMMGFQEEKELISFLVLINNIPLFQSSNNPVRIFQYLVG